MKLTEESSLLADFASKLPIILPDINTDQQSLLSRQYHNYSTWRAAVESIGIMTCERVKSRPNHLNKNDFADIPKFKSPKRALSYHRVFGNFHLRMHIESDKTDPSIQSVLDHLMAFMCMFGSTTMVNIFYAPTMAKKMLPKKGDIIGPAHINSGSTLAIGNGEIDVWRLEEHVKLFLHESVHCLKLDIPQFPPHLLAKFYEDFNINSKHCDISFQNCQTKLFPNEAYVEMIADIFNTMFICYEQVEGPEVKLNDLINIERKWAVFQCCKVLRHNGFKNVHQTATWYQKSDVFSYIIIRSALMFDFGKFIDFLAGGGSFVRFSVGNAKASLRRVEEFSDLIFSILRSSKFNDVIEQVMKASTDNSFIATTLRMTALENYSGYKE